MNHRFLSRFSAGVALSLCIALKSGSAAACGGFFCSSAQPVNQAAERIIFSQNGDGTVTAVIQIMYDGPSENFSWVLPVTTVLEEGDIRLASDAAFQRLQARTNPVYSLRTVVEGMCADSFGGGGFGGASASGGTSAGPPTVQPGGPNGGVTVESSGEIGEFEWTVISLDASLEDPADAAVNWLEENGYDVSPGSPELLGPYLSDGMYLLALKLKKGSDKGSIRPISITYEAERPMIPIKLTAVAANDDMGVMTWVLGEDRAIPVNYYSLELNEARINWFNAASNYNTIVTEAADEASGQGFVTELAGSTQALSNAIWSSGEDQQWMSFTSRVFGSFWELFEAANASYGSFSGFWDAVKKTVVLPDGVPFEDFKACPNCYQDEIEFSPSKFYTELEAAVIEPMREVQALIDSQPYITRLYSTLSAAEMTEDPLFSFNSDLEDVPNVHTADRIVECTPDVTQFQAPWRVEFPGGIVVRGSSADLQSRNWPVSIVDNPANRRVLQLSESGPGRVAADNTDDIKAVTNSPGSGGTSSGTGGNPAAGRPSTVTGGTSSATGGRPPSATGGTGGSPAPVGNDPPTGPGSNPPANPQASSSSGDDGCAFAGPNRGAGSFGLLLGAFAALGLLRRSRRGTRT